MAFIPRVSLFLNATATAVTNPLFGKSKGTTATLRMEFNDPMLRDRAYHIAITTTQPSCCKARYYTEMTVATDTSTRITVWINKNSFKKRLANPQGFFLLERVFPETAAKHPTLLQEAHRIRFRDLIRNSAPLRRPRRPIIPPILPPMQISSQTNNTALNIPSQTTDTSLVAE